MKTGCDAFSQGQIPKLIGNLFERNINYDISSDKERFKEDDYLFDECCNSSVHTEDNCFEEIKNTNYVVKRRSSINSLLSHYL